MRKLLSILLVSSILFNTCGYYFTFVIIKQGFRHDFRHHLNFAATKNDRVQLAITDAEIKAVHSQFRWMEQDEFRYKGKMYDVINSQKHGDTNLFVCLNDKKEEAMLAKYEGFVKHHIDSNLPYRQKSAQLLLQIVKEATCEKQKQPLFFVVIANCKSEYKFSLRTFITAPIEKPPNII
ncbi:MAG: hypothetical protein WCQ95_09565 [Bacteroidota bacterium]